MVKLWEPLRGYKNQHTAIIPTRLAPPLTLIPTDWRSDYGRNPSSDILIYPLALADSATQTPRPPSVEATFVRSRPSRFLFGCKVTSLQVSISHSTIISGWNYDMLFLQEYFFCCDAISHPTQKRRIERPQHGSMCGRGSLHYCRHIWMQLSLDYFTTMIHPVVHLVIFLSLPQIFRLFYSILVLIPSCWLYEILVCHQHLSFMIVCASTVWPNQFALTVRKELKSSSSYLSALTYCFD
jgi:hypothetical protein